MINLAAIDRAQVQHILYNSGKAYATCPKQKADRTYRSYQIEKSIRISKSQRKGK